MKGEVQFVKAKVKPLLKLWQVVQRNELVTRDVLWAALTHAQLPCERCNWPLLWPLSQHFLEAGVRTKP
eukprot:3753434-Amphidinium_carterae.2